MRQSNFPYSGSYFSNLRHDELSEFSEKKTFQMVENSCRKRENLIVLGDLNATIGTNRDAYELRVGPRGFGSQDGKSEALRLREKSGGDYSSIRARWAGYFEQYRVDQPDR